MKREAQTRAQGGITFWEAFRYWLKLGFISFGGPAGQIAMMHRELVDRRRWISEDRFLHALNFCMLLPGPEATQLAIYVGWLLHRTPGGIIAGVLFVLPSVFVLLALSYTYAAYGHLPSVAGMLEGFKPVVVAIVVEAILKIGRRALKSWAHAAIAAAAFTAIYFLRVPFPFIVVAAGLVGFLMGAGPVGPVEAKETKSGQASSEVAAASRNSLPADRPAPRVVIDDHAPPPAHTLPSRGRNLRVIVAGITLWIMPLAALIIVRGRGSLHAQEYLFFTQAALVTFGGAYAVLAYVTQATVLSYGWLSHNQAVDGLALAETTPGPLIMVLQFVGFLAAWNHPEGMPQTSSAVLGALVTTYATFLPCFLFIFLGAPYIELLRGNKSLTAALSGVTAAVVGVILNLALVFGATVIWPRGLAGGTNWFAAACSVAAFVALYRLKLNVVWIIIAGGLVGLIFTYLS